MAAEGSGEENQQESPSPALGLRGKIEAQYYKLKTDVETYPYVWGSNIVVYGGLGLWFAYRWRKLRKTEDRIRVLQARLRKHVEAQETSTVAEKSSKQSDKSPE